MADKVKYRKLRKAFAFNWRSIPCVVSATIISEPVQLDDGNWYWLDASGVRDGVLESNCGFSDGSDDTINFGIALSNTSFTYFNGTATQNATTDSSGNWLIPAGAFGDIRFASGSDLVDWFKVDESRGTTLYNSVQGRNNATLSNVDPLTFWIKDNRFYSWQNEVGYNIGSNGVLIPATVDTSGEMTGFDANGIPIYKKLTGSYELIFEGDSLTVGLNSSSGKSYPEQLRDNALAKFNDTITFINQSASGNTVVQMISQAPTQIDPLYSSDRKIVVFWGGINDLVQNNSLTGTDVANSVATWVSGRKAQGFEVAVCTMIDAINSVTDFQTKRTDFNNALRANTDIEVLVDLAAESIFDTNDSSIYSDGTHLTDLGYGYVADYVLRDIEYILNSQMYLSGQTTGYKSNLGRVRYNSKIVDSSVYFSDGIQGGIKAFQTQENIGTNYEVSITCKPNFDVTSDDIVAFYSEINDSYPFRFLAGRLRHQTSTGGTSFVQSDSLVQPPPDVYVEYKVIRSGTDIRFYQDNVDIGGGTASIDADMFIYSILNYRTFALKTFNGEVADIKIKVNGVDYLGYGGTEGGGFSVYDYTGNGRHGELVSVTENVFHAIDTVRPKNLLIGHDLWQKDGSRDIRIRFDINGNSILTDGDTPPENGYTWTARYEAGAWSNNPESNYIWPKCYATINADSKLSTPYLTDGAGNMVAKSHDDLVPNVLNEDIIFADALDDSKKRKVVITDGTCDFYTLLRIQRELDLIDGPLRITETGEIVRITETDEPIYVTKY